MCLQSSAGVAVPMNKINTLDRLVEAAIGEWFPDGTVPDDNNFLPNGSQYKAPDHSILGGKILIERKSRTIIDNSQFFEKLLKISFNQGRSIVGFGKINVADAIRELPDPISGNRIFSEYCHSQMWKRLKESNKKFEQHKIVTGGTCQTRLVIYSDESEMEGTNSDLEHFLGRKMGAYGNDETGLIDSIVYLKNPKYVLDDTNSYWFKFLTKRRIDPWHMALVAEMANKLHQRIAFDPVFNEDAHRFRKGHFRMLWV
jgi:hypothetical protein